MSLRSRLDHIERCLPPMLTCPHCGQLFPTPDDGDLLSPEVVLAEIHRDLGITGGRRRQTPTRPHPEHRP